MVLLAIFMWGLGISVAQDFGMEDESWFLRVCQRVLEGDVLYRDIFYGTTPLAVYLSSFVIRLVGIEIVVVKALVTLCFVTTVALAWRILRRLGASRLTAGCVGLMLLAYTSPQQASVYNPLANVWLLASFSATLSWLQARADAAVTTSRRLAIAGLTAGLCFATKQNIGLYTAFALFATVALTSLRHPSPWRCMRRDGGAALAWFLLGAGGLLAPILLSGGWPQFVDYGFTNKRTYLQVGDIGYMEGIRRIAYLWRRITPITLERTRELYIQLAYLLPFLITPGLLGGVFRWVWVTIRPGKHPRAARGIVPELRNRPRYAEAVAGFVGASFAGIYPRFDYSHVVYAVPCALIGLIWVRRRCGLFRFQRVRLLLGSVTLLWAGAGVLLISGQAISRVRSAEYQWSAIPHFRGVRIRRDEHAKITQYAARLHAIAAAEPVFLLTPYAGFSYLVAGVDNLTPFDYPLVTAFGRSGVQEVRRALEDGRITTVCLTRRSWSRLRPAALEEYVMEHFRRGEILQWCRIYRARAPALGR